MWRFIARRLLWSVFLFIAVTFVTYVIFFVAPNDPAKLAAGKSANSEQVEAAARYLNLDEPVWKQYLLWMKRLVFDQSLGRSFVNQRDVNEIIVAAAPVTFSLVLGGAILWLLVSIPIGVFSALRPRSLFDRSSMVFVLVGISAHPVWIGLILSFVFGSYLGLTPIAGYCDMINPAVGAECGGPVELGVPSDPALVHVRAAVRGAVRPSDPGERDGDDERGLRAHRPRQGRSGAERDAARTFSGTACSRS